MGTILPELPGCKDFHERSVICGQKTTPPILCLRDSVIIWHRHTRIFTNIASGFSRRFPQNTLLIFCLRITSLCCHYSNGPHAVFCFLCHAKGRASRPTSGEIMNSVIVGVISLLLFVYLLAAMLWPEKF